MKTCSFRRAASARSLCKSQRAAKPRCPRRSSPMSSLETPNAAPNPPSGPCSTWRSGDVAGFVAGNGLAFATGTGRFSKSTAEIRSAPRRHGCTPASSRSNNRRSASSERLPPGEESGVGLRDAIDRILARPPPERVARRATLRSLPTRPFRPGKTKPRLAGHSS